MSRLDLSGINPANVVPLADDGERIDESGLRSHLRDLVTTEGMNGIVCNGHVGEVYALTRDEQLRVVEIAREVTPDGMPVVSGVVGGSTTETVEQAGRMKEAGADGLLVIPPHTPINEHRRAAVTFFEDLSDGVDVPLVIFQHPTWAGGFYEPSLLAELIGVDNVVAVKDAVWDVDHYQEDVRAIRDADEDVQVLVANDEHLLPSFSIRSEGVILELAAVIPELVRDLHAAVEASDIAAARRVYARMEPFIDAMYEPPVTESHTRLKVALELQGRIDSAVPRRPGVPIDDEEVESIRESMEATGIL
ncbi:dihydrodipicolinate synthase family protein [Halorarum halobium]|uniref:dihydrodipicolinate synthase family protein n=1 Tax=Halorarum halobium TaxID=3075121 RepID=UPI0028AF4873|nr:dihydrodipicolinate synthase family protein [Halobaculum sp. XH14]